MIEEENDNIDTKWLNNMKEIYKRYEKFDEHITTSILCIIFFINRKGEIKELIKKKYKLNNNYFTSENIVNMVEEYNNDYRILDVFQSYTPYNHEEIEKKIYEKQPLVVKNVTNKDYIYYPNTTKFMKNLSNLIIFCKENNTISLFTKKIRIKDNKKTRKNKKIYNINLN